MSKLAQQLKDIADRLDLISFEGRMVIGHAFQIQDQAEALRNLASELEETEE